MKKIISLITAISLLYAVFVFHGNAENELLPSIGIQFPDVCNGIVDGTDRGVWEKTTADGLPAVSISPNPETDNNGILAVDNYGPALNKKKVVLDSYKYATIYYKYENVPDTFAPTIYIGSHSGEFIKGTNSVFVSTQSFVGGWRCTTVAFPDLAFAHPEQQHILQHFHLRPFGNQKVQTFDGAMTAYIHAVAFHSELPEETGVIVSYMSGNDDGTFRPFDYMTKAEACAIVTRLLGSSTAQGYEGETDFSDVVKGEWYYGYVAFCENMGLLSAYGDAFYPNEYITVDEFYDILLKTTITVPESAKNGDFSDNLNFGTDKYITRAEAVSFINSLYNISGEDFMKFNSYKGFSDVAKSLWAYEDIVGACSKVTYFRDKNSDEYQPLYYEYIEIPPSESDYLLGEAKLAEVEELEMERIIEIQSTETNVTVSGTSYYFAANGDDSNNGKSPDFPKKSISQIEYLGLKAGDGVFFRRGDTFRGTFTATAGVTYSSYGTGAKPIITASPANFAGGENWVETDTPNVWKLTTPIKHDVGVVVFDDGAAWSEKRIKGRDDFPTGDLSDLDADLVMWHDVSAPTGIEGYLYLRSDKGNPGKRFSSIEVAPRDHIIKAKNDILVDNICFKYTGAHGISAGTIENLTVQNCEFYFIGGSWFRTDTLSRYGNAVEVYGACDGYIVDNCYITQVYDAGVTHQLSNSPEKQCIMKDIKYTNNVITDTSYPIEYFFAKPDEGVEHKMVNVDISGNIIMRTGYGFGDQRPDKTAATSIKGWNTYNEAYNYTLKNNIFALSKYYLMAVAAADKAWAPVCDSNTYIQYYMGGFGSMLTDTSSEYNVVIKDFIVKTSKDENAEVYFLRPQNDG